jgi:hypothetical protein
MTLRAGVTPHPDQHERRRSQQIRKDLGAGGALKVRRDDTPVTVLPARGRAEFAERCERENDRLV